MLPVLGACTEAELVLVVDGADQFPKRDFTAGWAVGCVVVMEPVEGVPVVAFVIPGKTDGATVVLLIGPPNIEGVVLEETVEAGLVVLRDGGCLKPVLAVVAPKMGLKFWTGLLSGVDVLEEVVVTAKMGLNPEASKGLVLLMDSELLAGVEAVAVIKLEDEEAVGVLIWLASPNRFVAATGGVLLEALET